RRLRDGDRADVAGPREGDGHRGGAHPLSSAPGGQPFQAQPLRRRLPDPHHDGGPAAEPPAPLFLQPHRDRPRDLRPRVGGGVGDGRPAPVPAGDPCRGPGRSGGGGGGPGSRRRRAQRGDRRLPGAGRPRPEAAMTPVARPATEEQDQFESVSCNVCGSDQFEVVVPSKREAGRPVDLATVFRSSGDEPLQDQMVRCSSCGLHYVRPRLRWDLILEGYRGGSDETFVSQVAMRERTFKRCLDHIEKGAMPPGKRVLDVGAAGGSFLAIAERRGYQPMGCEPSTWMCTFAKQHYGLTLHPGTIFDMPIEPGSVDLLTLCDVIEHTPDPQAVIRRAHELLAPGGVLAISYPDYGSLAARAMGRKWVFLLT